MGWKSDWLYNLIFREVETLWERARREARDSPELFGPGPTALLVDECSGMDWDQVYCLKPDTRHWVYDGEAFQPSADGQRWEPDLTTPRHAFFRIGSVRFHVAPDRKRVGLAIILGPLYGRGFVFTVHGQGRTARLVKDQHANWWAS
jgi:hypothetical protein